MALEWQHYPFDGFYGRDEELASLEQMFSDGSTRLVSVVGPGGVGKTRLAEEFGVRFSLDGIQALFADLAPVTTREGVVQVILEQLGTPTIGDVSNEDLAASIEQRGPLLLIIDNAEHVRASVASIAYDCLARCPELLILATSRATLSVRGERVLWLDGLDDNAAIELFSNRRGSSLTTTEETDIRGASRALGGLPLTLELIAAQCQVLPIKTVIGGQLDGESDLISPELGRPERHESLHRSIDYSWNLLEDSDRDALFALAVVPSDFGASTLACFYPDRAAAIVQRLKRVSMCRRVNPRPNRGPRFQLFEGVRGFVLAKMSGDQRAHLEARYREFVLSRGHELESLLDSDEEQTVSATIEAERVGWLSVLRDPTIAQERKNGTLALLLSALRATGFLAETRRLLDEAIETSSEKDPWLPNLHAARARIHTLAENYPAAREECLRAIKSSKRHGKPKIEAEMTWSLAILPGTADADTLLEQSIALATAADAPAVRARAWMAVGMRYLERGDRQSAAQAFLDAVEAARKSGHHYTTALTLCNCALVTASSDQNLAERMMGESIELSRQADNPIQLAMSLAGYAWQRLISGGALDAVEKMAREVLNLAELHALGRLQFYAFRLLATVEHCRGNFCSAQALYMKSLSKGDALPVDGAEKRRRLALLALAEYQSGKADRAEDWLRMDSSTLSDEPPLQDIIFLRRWMGGRKADSSPVPSTSIPAETTDPHLRVLRRILNSTHDMPVTTKRLKRYEGEVVIDLSNDVIRSGSIEVSMARAHTLRTFLMTLASSSSLSATREELVRSLLDTEYDPLRHGGRLRVAASRLRKRLEPVGVTVVQQDDVFTLRCDQAITLLE